MTTPKLPEVWLRGPVPDVPALLQPAAHGLLQCREEVRETVPALDDAQLRARPGGVASVAYHVVHAVGSLDRLLTYARGEALDQAQLAALVAEARVNDQPADGAALAGRFDAAVERALAQLRATPADALTAPRAVGRQRLPSTVVGLLFHAAEHTQRHVGQLVTTAKLVRALGAD
ncbi:MAG TPA: DinB family protein [Gemmatimonadaceae bacterium]|nr:DinB family protein [Gemmatimonadaceae bacterium]